MKKKIILSAILSVIPFTAMAETPSFDYFDIGYSSWNREESDATRYSVGVRFNF